MGGSNFTPVDVEPAKNTVNLARWLVLVGVLGAICWFNVRVTSAPRGMRAMDTSYDDHLELLGDRVVALQARDEMKIWVAPSQELKYRLSSPNSRATVLPTGDPDTIYHRDKNLRLVDLTTGETTPLNAGSGWIAGFGNSTDEIIVRSGSGFVKTLIDDRSQSERIVLPEPGVDYPRQKYVETYTHSSGAFVAYDGGIWSHFVGQGFRFIGPVDPPESIDPIERELPGA